MEIHAAQILSDFKPRGILDAMMGRDTLITGIAPIEHCGPGDLVFVEKAELVQAARLAKPSAVVTTSELLEHFTDMSECAVFTSSNVR